MGDKKKSKKYLDKNREKIKSKYLNPLKDSHITDHIHKEESRKRQDGPFHRDYARIMYASSFRRLQGKMQLLGIKNDQFFRNRLTHSLEVAQIARSIANKIGYKSKESYVIEAGALAHDIGNPPFGHSGERKLHELFIDCGGFEGNAQTLRILTNVERKNPNFRGLNLTYRCMFGVVKYFRKFDVNKL
jgi:dGTPase